MRATLLFLTAVLVTGCATDAPEDLSAAPLAIPTDSRTQLIVNFKAGNQVFRNAHWDRFKASWRAAIEKEASSYGYSVTEQVGPITTTSTPGLLLVIKVDDFLYVSDPESDEDAWVDARVIYLDSQTAKEYGERSYNTNASSWESISAAMTNEQVQALAKRMVDEIRPPETSPSAPPPAPAAQIATGHEQGKQQQLEQLNRERLSYEEYQKRYREIVGQ